eukprot:PhM_4_TR13649/c1_g1_i4/m.32273
MFQKRTTPKSIMHSFLRLIFSLHPVVWICASANFLNQADRTLMSFAIVPITHDYGLSYAQRGVILSSFQVGYLLTQVVSGPACARVGSGVLVLLVAVGAWSVCTVLTPAAVHIVAASLWPLLVCRALMGLAEGFCWPATYHSVNACTGSSLRSTATAVLIAGGTAGQIVAVGLTACTHWTTQFVVLGSAGLVWSCTTRLLGITDRAETLAARGNTADVSYPASVYIRVFRRLLVTRSMVAIYIAHTAHNAMYFLFFTWMPTYLHEVHNVPTKDMVMMVFPLIAAAVFGPLFGILSDSVLVPRMSNIRSVRVTMNGIALLGPALLAMVMTSCESYLSVIVLYTIIIALASACSSGYMANHGDVFPRHTGLSFGLSSTLSALPGLFLGPAGAVLIESGRWDLLFSCITCVGVCGFLLYVWLGDSKDQSDVIEKEMVNVATVTTTNSSNSK